MGCRAGARTWRGGGEMAAVSLVLPYRSGLRSSMGWALLQWELRGMWLGSSMGSLGWGPKGKKPSCRHSSAEVGCWAWRNGGRGEGLHLSLFIFSRSTGWCVQGVSCLRSLDGIKPLGLGGVCEANYRRWRGTVFFSLPGDATLDERSKR